MALRHIHMFSATAGWALSDRGVLRTADGGNSWDPVTPPNVSFKNLALGAAVFMGWDFLEPSTAWVAAEAPEGIAVFGTTDGGRRWFQGILPRKGPEWLVNLDFIDPQDGWALLGAGVAAGSMGAQILRTTDGGRNWSLVSQVAAGPPRPSSLPFAGDKTGLSFRDADTGWANGNDPGGLPVWLYVTTDGGSSWRHQALSIPATWAYGRSGAVRVPSSIQVLPPRFFPGNGDGVLPVTIDKSDTPPSGVQRVLAATDFYITRDGGKTWTGTTPLVSSVSHPFIASFANPDDWWAASDGKLYATRNGGGSWTPVPTNLYLPDVRQLDFVAARTGWAVGGRLLWRTTDGGRVWRGIHPKVVGGSSS